MRYMGIKDNKICLISDNLVDIKDLKIIEIPDELNHVSSTDLIHNCRI
jgi:hypothetical protein